MAEQPKDTTTSHARRSRAARAWAEMSTEDLAFELGKKDRKYVERRENGQQDYSPGDLLKIAEVTGASVEFMTSGAGWAELAPDVATKATRAGREIAADLARKAKGPSQDRSTKAQGSGSRRNPEASN